jgi:hypothetical protein
MAKKKKAAKKATKSSRKSTAGKKPAKKAKKARIAPSRAAKPAKRKPAKKAPPKAMPAAPMRIPEYSPTFFLTAVSDTSQAYEIDGTPHHRTVESYRLERADILEYEEQDGKILYKVKPLKSPVG